MPLNFGAKMEDDIKEILMEEKVLDKRCKELGEEISRDFAGKNPVVIGVLNGAMVFMADLLRCISIPVEIESIAVSSYGKRSSSGDLKFNKDISEDVKGRHVIFVEDDIVDTGKTLKAVCALFAERGAASVTICTLLDKKARRAVEGLDLRYVGFDCRSATASTMPRGIGICPMWRL
ncbi:unnamed protein product [Effrenium voratum]|nr:unnamed protein product [Effrenium voratum]